MKFTPLFSSFLAIHLAACSSQDMDLANTAALGATPVNCVSFTSSFQVTSGQARLQLRNDCGHALDFSQSRIVFTGASPSQQPWGQLPPQFSWIDWKLERDGFRFERNPGETWGNYMLQPGQMLDLTFGADGQPHQARLYLGGGVIDTSPPGPGPNPSPWPAPEPTPSPWPAPEPNPSPWPAPNPSPWPAPAPAPGPNGPGHSPSQASVPTQGAMELVGYFPSWSAKWAGQAQNHQLAQLPPYLTTVLLSFARPDMSYRAGQFSWQGTGIDFSSDFHVVREAIAVLKARNPRTKVLLSVGGATYHNWHQLNVSAIAALVQDLGIDGADIDYEADSGCHWADGGNYCPSDQNFVQIIRNFRAALPRPRFMLTTAAWSTGAFGTQNFPASRFSPQIIGANFGLYINPLRMVGDHFDAIYIMSYDAGGPDIYDPRLAFEAYRDLYRGPLMLGIEVGREAAGGYTASPQDVSLRGEYVKSRDGQGLMIWSIYKDDYATYFQTACATLGLEGCQSPIH